MVVCVVRTEALRLVFGVGPDLVLELGLYLANVDLNLGRIIWYEMFSIGAP